MIFRISAKITAALARAACRRTPTKNIEDRQNFVAAPRTWHSGTVHSTPPTKVRFRSKADMVIALQMSAHDPKRTMRLPSRAGSTCQEVANKCLTISTDRFAPSHSIGCRGRKFSSSFISAVISYSFCDVSPFSSMPWACRALT